MKRNCVSKNVLLYCKGHKLICWFYKDNLGQIRAEKLNLKVQQLNSVNLLRKFICFLTINLMRKSLS